MKCPKCKGKYPDKYFQNMVTPKGIQRFCPECTRQEIGKVHGIKNYQFTGPVAKELYDDFMKFKKERGLS